MVRNALLEIDKFQGTPFPPRTINVEEKEYSMENIFLDADLKLVIRTDKQDIVDPVGGQDGAFTLEELDNVMLHHRTRSDSGENMSAYLLIVNGIYYSTDAENPGPDPSTLGVMFNLSQRLGTSVFYGADLIRSDEYAFFRTTIHELGHQFNLQHSDATSYFDSESRRFTIMNQTWIMRRHKSTEEEFQVPEGRFSDETKYPGWPKAIGFRFGEFEKIHLSAHDLSNVAPGGSRFGICDPVHSEWRQAYLGRID
jgi:hypothetical protein